MRGASRWLEACAGGTAVPAATARRAAASGSKRLGGGRSMVMLRLLETDGAQPGRVACGRRPGPGKAGRCVHRAIYVRRARLDALRYASRPAAVRRRLDE